MMELVERTSVWNDRVCVNKKALEAVLQQCHLAFQLLASGRDDDGNNDVAGELDVPNPQDLDGTCAPASRKTDTAEFYSLLKSRFECADFLKELENARASLPQNVAEEGNSWDMVSKNDLWGGGDVDLEAEDYVLVQQEDIIEGIAFFMAAYLLSLEQTKHLTPNQLQAALSKTFSVKKKGKLRKAWDGSRVIYNIASWGTTAMGIYQNPAVFRAASTAFWTSCLVISKLL